MKKHLYTARALFLGMVTAQIIATIQVYLSNTDLFQRLSVLSDSGYFIVPNQNIMSTLGEFWPAFAGGIFFTLSVGAGLSILSFSAAWIWDRFFSRKNFLLTPFVLIWIGCIVGANYRGFSTMAASYFLFIPPVVFLAALKWMPAKEGRRTWFMEIIPIVTLLLLTVIWASQMGKNMFLDIRDNILLSNPAGKEINDFYYKYTLYPAEVFKTLDQKMLKTCNLDELKGKRASRFLERRLLYHDYLNVGGYKEADLAVREDGKKLVFEHRGETILETTFEEYLKRPQAILKEFSSGCDRYPFFRKFVFFSILIGFPITLYTIVYALFRFLLSIFLNVRASSVISSIICFLIGIALLLPFQVSGKDHGDIKNLEEAMKSESWQVRVAALKRIGRKGLEIGDFSSYKTMMRSPHIPERYWLAETLGTSKKPETHNDLLFLLDDPHPNIRCKTFESLSRRRDKKAIQEITQRIESSNHWYCQWYAYRALRALGWKQQKST
jgi:hypothetical protein